MRSIFTLLLLLSVLNVIGQTPVSMISQPGLTYTETFQDITNWAFNPNADGTFTSGAGAAAWKGVAATAGSIPDPKSITHPSTYFSYSYFGGVQRDSLGQTLVLLAPGTTDNTSATAIDLYANFTGVNAGTLTFDWKSVRNSTGDRKASIRVYASLNGTTFVELTAAQVLNITNNVTASGSITNVSLPAFFNNAPTAVLRFYVYNGTGGASGSRPKVSFDNVKITATGGSACTTPAAQPTGFSTSQITDKTISATFTTANPTADRYLVIQSRNAALSALPVNGTTYNVGDAIGDGDVIAITNSNSFTATSLSPSTAYYFYIFSLNDICTGGPLYLTANPLTGSATTMAGFLPCAAPVSQPTNLVFSNVTSNSVAGSFTASAQTDEYLVIRSTSSTLTTLPVNGTTYDAGNAIGNGIVISRGGATNFYTDNLSPVTNYYFFVFALNSLNCNNGPAYNTASPLTLSTSTLPLPVCTTPTTQPTALELSPSNNTIIGDFIPATDADNFLVAYSTSSTLSALPQDGVNYVAGNTFGNATVISNSATTAFIVNNLTAGTDYYFFVFASNKTCTGGPNYNTANPLAGSTTTTTVAANNYYYGNLHAHSSYSDGNKDNLALTPADDYTFAKNSLCMDFVGISEHNHSGAGMNIANWRPGLAQARAATTPNFLALYGMEWGIISNGGHVVIYGSDKLLGWESGNYDQYVPRSNYLGTPQTNGTTGLFRTINNLGPNVFATLAHPDLTDFNNIANVPYSANADSAVVGTAVASGPAFSTSTFYNDPSSMDYYLPYYQQLLARGYHVGPTIDHDNHYTTFGRTANSRLAIIAPSLDSASFYNAMKSRHFYATEDCDTKVTFTLNNQMMGSIVSGRTAPGITIYAVDPTSPGYTPKIKLMYGIPGSGILPVKIDSVFNSTYTFTDYNLPVNSSAYYYAEITIRGRRTVTAPIWYNRTSSTFPVKLLSFGASPLADRTVRVSWRTANEINNKMFVVERSIDGKSFEAIHNELAQKINSRNGIYSWNDLNPFDGLNYYRLKQVDNDGKFTYSQIVAVNFKKGETNTVAIAPNPVSGVVRLKVTAKENEIATVKVTDVTGKAVYTEPISVAKGDQLITLNDSPIKAGTYFLAVQFKDQRIVSKFVKL